MSHLRVVWHVGSLANRFRPGSLVLSRETGEHHVIADPGEKLSVVITGVKTGYRQTLTYEDLKKSKNVLKPAYYQSLEEAKEAGEAIVCWRGLDGALRAPTVHVERVIYLLIRRPYHLSPELFPVRMPGGADYAVADFVVAKRTAMDLYSDLKLRNLWNPINQGLCSARLSVLFTPGDKCGSDTKLVVRLHHVVPTAAKKRKWVQEHQEILE